MSCDPIVDGIRATLPDAPRLSAVTGKGAARVGEPHVIHQ